MAIERQFVFLGHRVRQLRKAYGVAWRKKEMTQGEFGERLNVTCDQISRLEIGKTPTARLLFSLSQFAHNAGCLTWLMTGEGELTISPSAIRAEYKSIIGKETGNDMDVTTASSNK